MGPAGLDAGRVGGGALLPALVPAAAGAAARAAVSAVQGGLLAAGPQREYMPAAPTCHCPLNNGRRACKGDDPTPPNYLFLGPNGGHLRRSNYADRYLTPAAEGLYPAYKGVRRPVYVTAEPWPGIPIRKGNRKAKAADIADATWPNLTGKYTPHGDRHTHATWLEAADIHKVVQMDRRGHAMSGMDAIYTHITPEMRQRLCDVLETLWQNALAQRHELSARSAVPLLNQLLITYEQRNNAVTTTGPVLPQPPLEPGR